MFIKFICVFNTRPFQRSRCVNNFQVPTLFMLSNDSSLGAILLYVNHIPKSKIPYFSFNSFHPRSLVKISKRNISPNRLDGIGKCTRKSYDIEF